MAGYYFRLPQMAELTIPQQAAVNETKHIALSGGPGTGKSVVSLWRHINNHINGTNSFLITYTTTLKRYLSACAKLQNEKAGHNTGSAYRSRLHIKRNHYDEIIIDEAQDLGTDLDYLEGENYYEGIGDSVSYGADDSQILYPQHCSRQSELKARFPNNVDYVLDKNFRSTYYIMKFAKACFINAYIPKIPLQDLKERNIGELPVFMVAGRNDWMEDEGHYAVSNDKQNDAIKKIVESFRSETSNIAILLPFKKDVKAFKTEIEGMDITDFSWYYEDKMDFPNGCPELKNLHITTFKSSKGLEFDTVIIPNFSNSMTLCERERYNNKWQDLYVACTRARSNLYLISNNDMPNLANVVDKTIL